MRMDKETQKRRLGRIKLFLESRIPIIYWQNIRQDKGRQGSYLGVFQQTREGMRYWDWIASIKKHVF